MISEGRQIAAARMWIGWTQSDLADRAGLSRGAISYWEAKAAIKRHDHAPNSGPTRMLAAFQAEGMDIASDPKPAILRGGVDG